ELGAGVVPDDPEEGEVPYGPRAETLDGGAGGAVAAERTEGQGLGAAGDAGLGRPRRARGRFSRRRRSRGRRGGGRGEGEGEGGGTRHTDGGSKDPTPTPEVGHSRTNLSIQDVTGRRSPFRRTGVAAGRCPRAAPRTLARVNASARTPADLLSSALAADPGRPLVTFYDDATGERVELSVATFANWVAKTANLLQDELSAEPGDRVALLLPAHWQTAVWLLACASVGVVADVASPDPGAADIVVSGPDTLDAARACSGARVALALRPLGGRFPQPPEGFADY